MSAYMEMLRLDSEGNALKTNLASAAETDRGTRFLFESYKRYEVPADDATFLLDLHADNHDLLDTIMLDDAGFTKITGHIAKSDADYAEIDREHWSEIQRERPAPSSQQGEG